MTANDSCIFVHVLHVHNSEDKNLKYLFHWANPLRGSSRSGCPGLTDTYGEADDTCWLF